MIGVVCVLLKMVKHKCHCDFISKKAACTGFSKDTVISVNNFTNLNRSSKPFGAAWHQKAYLFSGRRRHTAGFYTSSLHTPASGAFLAPLGNQTNRAIILSAYRLLWPACKGWYARPLLPIFETRCKPLNLPLSRITGLNPK